MAAPDRLYFTEDDEACRLIAEDPFALLVGFALDQQITVQQAFAGPLRIKQRVGTLEPERIAKLDPERLLEAFRQKPAVHRFPGSMATRVQDLAQAIVDDYDGRADRVWTEAADADDLRKRLGALPGFGEMKVRTIGAVLAKQFGVAAAQPFVPDHMTLGDVDSPQKLVEYQTAKRAHKALLWGMYVRATARNAGVGKRLVAAVLDHARGRVEQVQLTVVSENEAARRLYCAMGFVEYGYEKRALRQDGKYYDDILMVHFLDEA